MAAACMLEIRSFARAETPFPVGRNATGYSNPFLASYLHVASKPLSTVIGPGGADRPLPE